MKHYLVGYNCENLLSHDRSEHETMEVPAETDVVVCGPPGTEPRHGFSRTRFDHEESVVYSRSSTSLSSEPSPLEQYMIPLKDTPKELLTVEVCVRDEDIRSALRCTRARTNMFNRATRKKSHLESESDSSEETSSFSDSAESSEEVSTRLRENVKSMNRNRCADQPSKTKPPPVRPPPIKVCNQNTLRRHDVICCNPPPLCVCSSLLLAKVMERFWSDCFVAVVVGRLMVVKLTQAVSW